MTNKSILTEGKVIKAPSNPETRYPQPNERREK